LPALSSGDRIRRVWTKTSRPRFLSTGVSCVSQETVGSADGQKAAGPVTLRHVDTGDWRYGRGSDGAPWTEPSTGSIPTPDLWTDEDADTSGWASTASWRPRRQADPTDSSPISPSPIEPDPTGPPATRNGSYGSGIGSPAGFPSGGYAIPGFGPGYAAAHPAPRYGAPAPGAADSTYGESTYGESTYGDSSYGRATYGGGTYGAAGFGGGNNDGDSTYSSAPSSGAAYGSAPSSGAAYGSAPSSGAAYDLGPSSGAAYGLAPSSGAAFGSTRSFGTSTALRTAAPLGQDSRRAAAASRVAASRRGGSGEDASGGTSFGRVFGFTAIWYGAPLVLYLLWLVITSGDREAVAGRALVAAIPWMLAAVAVSAGLAVLLRRITVGWGTVGVSFAAAVIGAGLATIIHSFA
jgi:hypothetical protein